MLLLRCVLVSAALLNGAAASASADDALDASIRMLRRAATPQRDGSHLALLNAIRQLHDPGLRPLLHHLLDQTDWMMQVHAVLGLAELTSPPRLTPLLVVRAAPRAQEVIIVNAIDLELLDVALMNEMRAWDELTPMARLMLSAELVSRGESAVGPDLKRFLDHEDDRVRALAACLRAQLDEPGAVDAAIEIIDAGDANVRRQNLLWVLDAIRQYRLTSMSGWVDRLLGRSDLDERVVEDALFTLLTLVPDRGLARWREHIGPDASYPKRARFAMMLLSSADALPPEAFNMVPGHEPLIARIVEVGRARMSGSEVVRPMIELYDLGNLRAIEWVIAEASLMDASQAKRVYSHMLDRLDTDPPGRPEQAAVAVRAVAPFFAIDPDAVRRRLETAVAGSLSQQALLLGLMDADIAEPESILELLPTGGFGRSDSLALLLRARHQASLSPEQLRRLGLIASGGGRVSEPLQVQAAWLYIKHSGAIDRALNRVFAR